MVTLCKTPNSAPGVVLPLPSGATVTQATNQDGQLTGCYGYSDGTHVVILPGKHEYAVLSIANGMVTLANPWGPRGASATGASTFTMPLADYRKLFFDVSISSGGIPGAA